MSRRTVLLAALGLAASSCAADEGCAAERADSIVLDAARSRVFRAWMVRIVNEQVRQGPTPRWFHRDCAGLVRFAVTEALRPHDPAWLRANGLSARALPPELDLTPADRRGLAGWAQPDGSRGPFATAEVLVTANCHARGKDLNAAEPGDLLFFDQGDDHHLMVWMGSYVAYHTGFETPSDNGLRAVALQQLTHWKDTRWRPLSGNPNFVGVFRLSFLSR